MLSCEASGAGAESKPFVSGERERPSPGQAGGQVRLCPILPSPRSCLLPQGSWRLKVTSSKAPGALGTRQPRARAVTPHPGTLRLLSLTSLCAQDGEKAWAPSPCFGFLGRRSVRIRQETRAPCPAAPPLPGLGPLFPFPFLSLPRHRALSPDPGIAFRLGYSAITQFHLWEVLS